MEPRETTEEKETRRLLLQIVQQQQLQTSALKKQLLFTRLAALLLAGMLVVFLGIAGALLPQAREVLTDLGGISRQLASVDWLQLTQEISNLAQTSEQSLVSATEQIQKLDLDALNQAIQELHAVIRPLADLFG